MTPRLPVERVLRVALLELLEAVAEADVLGRWDAAARAAEVLAAELRARATARAPAALEPGRRERLTRGEIAAEEGGAS